MIIKRNRCINRIDDRSRTESSALSYLTVSSRGRDTPTEFNELVRSDRDAVRDARAHRANKPLSEGLTYAEDFRAT